MSFSNRPSKRSCVLPVQPARHVVAVWRMAIVVLVNAVVLCIPIMFVPVRTGPVALGLFLAGATALCLADLSRLGFTDVGDDESQTRTHRPICFGVGISVITTWWLGLVTGQGSSNTLFPVMPLAGFAAMILGSELRRRAIRTLAADFVSDVSPTESCQLRTSGLYEYVRHPSESGLLLCVLGGAMTLGSWPSLWLWLVVLVPLSVIRVLMEEEKLRNKFGAEYDRYVNRTGRYLPRCAAINLRTRFLEF